MKRILLTVAAAMLSAGVMAGPGDRQAYFGDLHVHTRYSFDAFIFNVRADPDDAYRYARGEPLEHPLGYPIRLHGPPLDFMAVTEHATYLGVLSAMGDPSHPLSKTPLAAQLISNDPATVFSAFSGVARAVVSGEADPRLQHEDVIRSTWQQIIASAERNYVPGKFTTFIAYEYTSSNPYNLHRNVIFAGSRAPERPFAATDSLDPEDLWDWMDGLRAQGIEALAIPHNSNWSNGAMFARTRWDGSKLSADYAAQRTRNEPLVEMTQVKGTSDTHPLLSPNDEWADFEIFADSAPAYGIVSTGGEFKRELHGSYIRDALLEGLALERRQGFNPFRFGLIGSSDTHNGGAPYEEPRFFSKTGINDGSPERRGSVYPAEVGSWEAEFARPPEQRPAPYLIEWGAAGLAGVWAEENTRPAIYAALRRKETFATSGTRLRVRFFAGYGLDLLNPDDPDLAQRLYANGVPMGGDLAARRGASPSFFAWASRDPQSAWLDRIQIIKGWIENGRTREQVFDIACGKGDAPDPATHRCHHQPTPVDTSTCAIDATAGAAELRTVWHDPTFDPKQRAFYYVRVLEHPTCRWSTWDALRAGIPPRPDVAPTIQERAWSSPIWIQPAG